MAGIENMPAVLGWSLQDDILRDVHRQYVTLLCDLMGYCLGKALSSGVPGSELLRERLNELDNQEYERLLLAPETSFRLFFRPNDLHGNISFLSTSAEAEIFKRNPDADALLEKELWSALGDFGAVPQADGFPQRIEAARLGGRLPIDMDSPHALNIPFVDDDRDILQFSHCSERFSAHEKSVVTNRFKLVQQGIEGTSPFASGLVLNFTKVIIARKDSDERTFSSGSSGQYTGRSLLVNVHRGFVSPGLLADAIVHEAIHAVLYMLERIRAWVSNDDLYEGSNARVISPWSGRNLRLRPFLQACFVWFGLLNFWSRPEAALYFDSEEAELFKNRALGGFQFGPLVDRIDTWRPEIDPELVETIDALQQLVNQGAYGRG